MTSSLPNRAARPLWACALLALAWTWASPAGARADEAGMLKIWLPADAQLWINDTETQLTGSVRVFPTTPLSPDKGHAYVLKATWYEDGETVTVERTVRVWAGWSTRVDLRRPKKWPDYYYELSGQEQVKIVNPNPYKVAVGLRAGDSWGKDFVVPAYGERTVYVPASNYQVYFQYMNVRHKLFKGEGFTLNDREIITIRLVKVVGGNFNIQEVED